MKGGKASKFASTRSSAKSRLRTGSRSSSRTFRKHHSRFSKLYRHPFGSRTSPFRKRAKVWLRSLRTGDDYYECEQCRNSKRKCDREELRCQSCVDRHVSCPRTGYFKRSVIMQDLKLTEKEYEELQGRMPYHRGRPPGSTLRISENSSEEVSTEPDPESEEVDELESDVEDSDNRHVASSSRAARTSSPSASSSSSVPLSKRKATPKMRRLRDGRGRYTISRPRSNHSPTYTSRAKPSLRTSKETPTHIAESSTDLARHEHLMKELGSIQSRLDIIHDSIKTILPIRRKLTENKENEPAVRESTERNAFPHEAPLKQVQDKAHAGITRPTRAPLSDHSQTTPRSSSNIDERHAGRQTPMSGTVNPRHINEGFVAPTTDADQPSLNAGFRFSVGGHSDSDHPSFTPPERLLPPIAAIEELPEARSSTRSP